MNINLDEIKKVAKLCKFNITEEEAALYCQQLSAVLGWVDALQNIDTTTTSQQQQNAGCPLREDIPLQSPAAAKITAAFTDQQNNLLKVKKVL